MAVFKVLMLRHDEVETVQLKKYSAPCTLQCSSMLLSAIMLKRNHMHARTYANSVYLVFVLVDQMHKYNRFCSQCVITLAQGSHRSY
jgi:hypothetical protein